SRSGRCVVTRTTRSGPAASIIATSRSPVRCASISVRPGYRNPARWRACLCTGPVTIASTVPARASSTARSTAWAATRPASSGSRERGAVRSRAPEGSAPRYPLYSRVMSASSGPRASAFATTSGPIPRGSPRVTARRGRATRSGANVDVRRAAQNVEVVLYRELLAHVLADPILHVVEGQLTFGQALHELEYDELGPPRIRARREHRLQPRHGVAADRALVVRRQLRHGQLRHDLPLLGIAVAARQRVER